MERRSVPHLQGRAQHSESTANESFTVIVPFENVHRAVDYASRLEYIEVHGDVKQDKLSECHDAL